MLDVLNFLWSLPGPLCKHFFAFRHIAVPATFPWHASALTRALELVHIINLAPEPQRASLLTDLREADALADDDGYRAILNACPPDHGLVATLAAMPGFAERALWTQWKDWPVLDNALAIRLVDEHGQTPRSQRTLVPGAPPRRATADDYDAFAAEMELHFREQEHVDEPVLLTAARRYQDKAIQFVLYADDHAEAHGINASAMMHASRVRPSMRLAVIYGEITGSLDTIVSSGKSYHAMVRDAFIRHVLKIETANGTDAAQSVASYRLRHESALHSSLDRDAAPTRLAKPGSPSSAIVEIATDGRWMRVNGRELRLKGKQRDFALVMVQAHQEGRYRPQREWALRKAGYGPSITDLKQISTRSDFLDFFGYGNGEVWIIGAG